MRPKPPRYRVPGGISRECIAIGCLLTVSAVTGTEPTPPNGLSTDEMKKLSLEELMQVEVPTVYGASKHDQKATDAPSSVTVVTQEEIKKYGHRTLSDILNSVRRLYVTFDRGYSYIGAGGFNRPGDYGGRILLMIDGHRLNDAVYDTAASGVDFPLDVDMIERVEVIRGPGSSLYGSNAFFGVINVITRRGRSLDGAELASSYGSFDTWTGRASYGRRLTNGVEFALSGTLYDSAGQRRLSYPEFVAENLDGGWARNGFASISYRDFTLQGGVGHRQKDWPTAAYESVPNSHNPRMTTDDEREWVDLSFRREIAEEWLVSARAYFDRYSYDGGYPLDYDGDPNTAPTLNRDLALSLSAGLDVSVSRTFWDTHQLTLGSEWRHDFEVLQRNWDSEPFQEYSNSRASADLFGIYLQDEWKIRNNLIFNAGVRYDNYSAFGDTLNPRAALIYSPWDSSTFKFLYGQAFRAPNGYELYYTSYNAVSNPALRPESIRSYEVVWEQQLGPHWRTSLSLFWNDVSDLVTESLNPGPDPISTEDDRYTFTNSGGARARGVELELETKLSEGTQARASYTFVNTEDTATGLRLNNSPQHLAKLNVTQAIWQEKVFASVELQAMSSRTTVAGATIDPFAVVNFTLFSRELVKGLEVSGSIYNVFDARYSHPVSADYYYIGPVTGNTIALDSVEQDGRTFRVKLAYRF